MFFFWSRDAYVATACRGLCHPSVALRLRAQRCYAPFCIEVHADLVGGRNPAWYAL